MNKPLTCACADCQEPPIDGGIFCPFCEDHHYHTHGDDGTLIIGTKKTPAPEPLRTPDRPAKYHEYDTFRLAVPIDDETIPVGIRGVVLIIFGGTPCQYEVEFPDNRGGNLGRSTSYTVSEDQMTPESESSS